MSGLRTGYTGHLSAAVDFCYAELNLNKYTMRFAFGFFVDPNFVLIVADKGQENSTSWTILSHLNIIRPHNRDPNRYYICSESLRLITSTERNTSDLAVYSLLNLSETELTQWRSSAVLTSVKSFHPRWADAYLACCTLRPWRRVPNGPHTQCTLSLSLSCQTTYRHGGSQHRVPLGSQSYL